jgi:hypothetical protein
MKRMIVLTLLLSLGLSLAQAKPVKQNLTEEDIARLKAVREIVYDVEKKSLRQMIDAVEKTQYPEINLEIKEAMAHTYADIIREQNVQSQPKKEWLYSMIALNVAYFQFGGDKDSAGGTKNLNKLIRYKLKTYLPLNIFNQPGFHCALG